MWLIGDTDRIREPPPVHSIPFRSFRPVFFIRSFDWINERNDFRNYLQNHIRKDIATDSKGTIEIDSLSRLVSSIAPVKANPTRTLG